MALAMTTGTVNANNALENLNMDEAAHANKKNIVKVRAKVAQALLDGDILPPVQDEQLTLARHLGTRYVPTQKPFSSLSCAKYLHIDHVKTFSKIFAAYNVLLDRCDTSPFLQLLSAKANGGTPGGCSSGPAPPSSRNGRLRAMADTADAPSSSDPNHFEPGDLAISREWFVEILLCVIASQLEVSIPAHLLPATTVAGGGSLGVSTSTGLSAAAPVTQQHAHQLPIHPTKPQTASCSAAASSLPKRSGPNLSSFTARAAEADSDADTAVAFSSPILIKAPPSTGTFALPDGTKPPALHQTFGAPHVLPPGAVSSDHASSRRQPETFPNKHRLHLVDADESSVTAIPGEQTAVAGPPPPPPGGRPVSGPTGESIGSTATAEFASQRPTLIREMRRKAKEQLLQQFREEIMEWIEPLCHPLDSHQMPPVWEACDKQVKMLERFHAAARQAYQRYKQGDQLFLSSTNLSQNNNMGRNMGEADGALSLSRPGTRLASPTHATPPGTSQVPDRHAHNVSVKPVSKNRMRLGDPILHNNSSCATFSAGQPSLQQAGRSEKGGFHSFADMNHVSPSVRSHSPTVGSPYSSGAGGSTTNGVACLTALLSGEAVEECPILQEYLYCRCQFIVPLVPNRWEEPQPELWTSMLFFGETGDGKAAPTWMDLLRIPERAALLCQVHQEFPVIFPQGKRRKACDRHHLVCWSDITNNLIMDFEQNRLTTSLELTYTRVPTMMLEEENRGKNGPKHEDGHSRGGDGDDDDDEGGGGVGGGTGRSRRALRKPGASTSDVNSTVQSDLETFAEELKGLHTQSADKVLISTAQPSIITSSKDGVIKVWEPRWGQFTSNLLNVGDAWVLGMWLLHDDQYMMVATSNAELTILEFPKGAIIQKFRGCSTLVTAMRQVTQMGTTLIHRFGLRPGECGPHRTDYKSGMTSEEYRKMFREAQITTDRAVHPAKPIDGFVSPSAVYFEPTQGGMLFFGTVEGVVGCFDLTHEVKQSTILSGANMNPIHLNSAVQAHQSGVRVVGLVFCASGGYLISCGEDGSVVRISFAKDIKNYHGSDTITLSDPQEIMRTPRSTRLLESCHTHRVFTTVHSDRRVLLWTLGRHTAEFTHQFPQETQDIISITFITAHKRVAFLSADRCVRIYDFRGFRPLSVIYPSRIAENNAEDVASVTLKCSMEDGDGCVAFLPESSRIVCALRGPVMYEPAKVPLNGAGLPGTASTAVLAAAQQQAAVNSIPTTLVSTASFKAGLPLLPPEDSDDEPSESESSDISGESVTSERIREHEKKRERRAAAKSAFAAHRLQKRRLRPHTTHSKSVVSVIVHRTSGMIHTFSAKQWKTWDIFTGYLVRCVEVTDVINTELPMFKKTFLTSCSWTTESRTRLMVGARDGHCVTLDADHGSVVQVEKIVSESRVRGELLDKDTSIVFHFKNRTIICCGRTLVVRRYIPGELRASGEEEYTSMTLKLPVKTTITACCVIRDAHVCVGTIDTKLYFFRLIDQSGPYYEETLSRVVVPPPPPGAEDPEHCVDPEIGAVVGLTFVNEVNQNLLFILVDTGVMFVFSTLRTVMLTRFLLLKPDVCRIRSFFHVRSENMALVGTTLGQVLVLDLSQCSSADVDFRHCIRVMYCFRAATSEIVGIDFFKLSSHLVQRLHPHGALPQGMTAADSTYPSPANTSPSVSPIAATSGHRTPLPASAVPPTSALSKVSEHRTRSPYYHNISNTTHAPSHQTPHISASSNNTHHHNHTSSVVNNSESSTSNNNAPQPMQGSLESNPITPAHRFGSGNSTSSFLVVASVDGNVRVFSMDSVITTYDGPNSPSSCRTSNLNHRPSFSLHSTRLSSADVNPGDSSSQPSMQPSSSQTGTGGGLLRSARQATSTRGGMASQSNPFFVTPYMDYFQGVASACTTVGLLGLEEWDLLQSNSFAANAIPAFQPTPQHQANEAFLDHVLREGKAHALAAPGGPGVGGSPTTAAATSAASPVAEASIDGPTATGPASSSNFETVPTIGGDSALSGIANALAASSLGGLSVVESVCYSASPTHAASRCARANAAELQAQHHAHAAAAAATALEYKLNFCRGKASKRLPQNTTSNLNTASWGCKEEGSASDSATDINEGDPAVGLPDSPSVPRHCVSSPGVLIPALHPLPYTPGATTTPNALPVTIPAHDLTSVLAPTTKSLLMTIPSEKKLEVFASSVGPQKTLKESKYKRNYLLRTYPLKWLRKIQVVPTMDHAEEDLNENVDVDADVAFSGINVNEHVMLVALQSKQNVTTGPLPSNSPTPLAIHPPSPGFDRGVESGILPNHGGTVTSSPVGGVPASSSPVFMTAVSDGDGGAALETNETNSLSCATVVPSATPPAHSSRDREAERRGAAPFCRSPPGSPMGIAASVSSFAPQGSVEQQRPGSRAGVRPSRVIVAEEPPQLRMHRVPLPGAASSPSLGATGRSLTGGTSLSLSMAGGPSAGATLMLENLENEPATGERVTNRIQRRASMLPLVTESHAEAAGFNAHSGNVSAPTGSSGWERNSAQVGTGDVFFSGPSSHPIGARDTPPRSAVTFPGETPSSVDNNSVYSQENAASGGDIPSGLVTTSATTQLHHSTSTTAIPTTTTAPLLGGAGSNVYDQLRQTPVEVLEQRRDQLMLAYMAQRLDKVRPHGHARHEFIDDVKRVWVRRAGEAQVIAETRAAALAAVNPFSSDHKKDVRHHPGIAQMTQAMNQELQRGESGPRVEVNLNLLTMPTEARSAQEENMRLSARERLKAQLKVMSQQREAEATERHRLEETNPNPKDRRYWLPLISAKQPTHPIRITLPSTLREDDGAKQQLRQLQQLVASTNAAMERSGTNGPGGGVEDRAPSEAGRTASVPVSPELSQQSKSTK